VSGPVRPLSFEPATDEATAFACALCGLRFTHGGQVCASCPITHGCDDLVRCPRCGYQFPRGSRTLAWVQRLWRRLRGPAALLRAHRAGGRPRPLDTRSRPGVDTKEDR